MNQFFSFIFGLLAGFTITLLCIYPQKLLYQTNVVLTNGAVFDNVSANPLIFNNDTQPYEDLLSEKLFDEVRILCWVLTGPKNHRKKAIHVMRTWGQRCTKLLFMSSLVDPVLGSIALPVKEGRNNLWDKTKHSLEYIYKHHFGDAEWFLKVDDDNYVFLENLRYMLSRYRHQTSLYFGHRYTNEELSEGYMAGGGYILSKKALEKFVTKIMHNETICNQNNVGSEDLEVGRCLQHSAIFADERDELKQKRFFPAGLPDHLKREKDPTFWYDITQYYEVAQGSIKCCSDIPISFHYVEPREMYALEYFTRHAHPFGFEKNSTETLPRKLKLDEIIKAADVESASEFYRKHKLFHDLEESEKYKKK